MKYDLSNYTAICEAEKQATIRANAENNQSSYNAGWLHGYARALADVRRDLFPTEFFGVVRWCDADIEAAFNDLGYKISPEAISTIKQELTHHGFTDHMISAGWDYINYIINTNGNLEEAGENT